MSRWFANPWALWLPMLLTPLTLAALWAARRRRKALGRLGGIAGLTALARRGWLNPIRGLLLSTGLTLLAVGIAGPQWGRDWTQAASGRDLVVVLDLSRSMQAEVPSRLQRSRDALIEMSYAVQQRGGHRLALVVFAGRAKVVCPLTHDYDHFRYALEQIDVKQVPGDLEPAGAKDSGTRIGAALAEAVAAHDERFPGAQDILLVSDGDDPMLGDNEWRAGMAKARDAGIPVWTVGVGDPDESSPVPTPDGPLRDARGREVRTKLHEEPLREIARLTNGRYTPARTQALPLAELFQTHIEPRPARAEGVDVLAVYRQHAGWFLGGALGLLALEMLLGCRQTGERGAQAP
ncbi:MAG TPA: VWA domain-containing protein [Gemmataceae bacterium]|nr:VWA domain-containing protein [Gemmataceae bacterium]